MGMLPASVAKRRGMRAAASRAVCYARPMRRFPRLIAPSTLAVVDMGSNSFRLELGRVEGDQIFRLDTWRENLRVGAGLDRTGRLTAAKQRAAIACLARFGERLRGFHPSAVRAV